MEIRTDKLSNPYPTRSTGANAGGEPENPTRSPAPISARSTARSGVTRGGGAIHRATSEGIRALRQAIIRNRHEQRWNLLLATADDFYSMSGCRDLFFNVMEHTFTIPDIAALLAEHGLAFLGFELDADDIRILQGN